MIEIIPGFMFGPPLKIKFLKNPGVDSLNIFFKCIAALLPLLGNNSFNKFKLCLKNFNEYSKSRLSPPSKVFLRLIPCNTKISLSIAH